MVVAGCGGDDDKGPTKAAYITKADAVCKAANDKLTKAAADIGASPTAAQVKTFAAQTAVPNLEAELKELRALDRPKDDKDTIGAIYDALEDAVGKLKSDPSVLTGQTNPFTEANAKAKAYGLKVCGAT
jgi:hypothetical protein